MAFRMRGSQKWLLLWLIAIFIELIVGAAPFSTVPVIFDLTFFTCFVYCLGSQVARSEMEEERKIFYAEGLKCDSCGQPPHLHELEGMWLCDNCYIKALDPHCPVCQVLIEPDSKEARLKHLKETHPKEYQEHSKSKKGL